MFQNDAHHYWGKMVIDFSNLPTSLGVEELTIQSYTALLKPAKPEAEAEARGEAEGREFDS